MRRGTTPSIRLTTDADLTGCDEVNVAIKNGRLVIVKGIEDLDIQGYDGGTAVVVRLEQDETLQLDPLLKASIQIRFRKGDDACATEIKQVAVEDILQEGVI